MMRLKISKSKNAASFYVIQSFRKNGVSTSKVIEKLGTEKELREKLNGADPYVWAKEYVDKLNELEKQGKEPNIIKEFSPVNLMPTGRQNSFNVGYLFLQKIYHELKLDRICSKISKNYKFEYDLNSILSRLIYGRILFPSSKKSTFEESKKLLQPVDFELHDVYRALGVLAKEMDFIQAQTYKNSFELCERKTGVLYYDCTNFFFEIEEEKGLRKYGYSKENRPNPIVQMGLFMDASGMPLAFNIFSGNTNEQITLKPLEQTIIQDFELSKFVVCTDAGLSGTPSRKFNNINNRGFITTQSLKNLKGYIKEWALSPKDWILEGSNTLKTYDISLLSDREQKMYYDKVFYKERWINEKGLEQRILVTFSLKYKAYHENIREKRINKALTSLQTPSKLDKLGKNNYKELIKKISITESGEQAKQRTYVLDEELIKDQTKYDGFYAVCTNLEDEAREIVSVNKRRWQIEECFRIMKSEFKARPVYLSRDDAIKAHFLICFLSLLVYRILEKRLEDEFSIKEIIDKLKEMEVNKLDEQGYIPNYMRDYISDRLHEISGFRTDYEIISKKNMKKIFKSTKT